MFKKLTLLSTVLLLAACSEYGRYGMTDEQLAIDTKACHAQALKAIPPGTGDYSAVDAAKRQCMLGKGYQLYMIKPPFMSLRGDDRRE